MGCFFSKESNESTTPYKRRVTTNIHDDILGIHRRQTNQHFTHPRQHVALYEPQYRNTESYQLKTRLGTRNNTTTIKAAVEKPLYGEYKCNNCGRFWNSRLCWPGTYQLCKKCKKPVFPHITRELLPSDHSNDKENKEHEKELCQMCKSLGYYCNNKNKIYKHSLY
ncbi:uncharacterized protein LOC123664558 [Melitaea cinxia]|uniref:uncharacterized protein LOC123664558 n=1 Tax=Melitaea cinxia TaxID=113334 RepID=UPI001E270299|nr:uncharacterized protein LOC123664558 [Melitaea cinxia]